MTPWTANQYTKAQLAGLEALIGLTNKALEGVAKVTELNLETMRTTLARTQEGITKALSAQNPQGFVNLQVELVQPTADTVLVYRRQLFDILAATRAEFEKAIEAQYTSGKDQLQGLIEGAMSSALPDSAAPLAAWQEVFSTTTALFESMQSTAKQAVQVAESTFNTATQTAPKDTRRRAAQALPAAAN